MTADPIRDDFAGRLDHLMSTVSQPDGSRWTNVGMAHALRDIGVAASAPYVSQLRSGAKCNPSASYVGAFAKVLGVPVTYFYAGDTTELDQAMAAMTLWRADGVQEIAELVRGLPPHAIAAIAGVAATFRNLAGLPAVEDGH